MSWWRRHTEVREAEGGYTEIQLLDQLTRAISGNVRHGALGGLQCAAGAVARAFAAAEVDGDAEGLLDPTTLYQMGFDLVREGQTIWLLEAGTGGLRLSRASTGTDVYQGAAAAESWIYRVTTNGPSITATVRASADRVIHIRQNSDPTCPWRGRSGLAVAQSSGGLAATPGARAHCRGRSPLSRASFHSRRATLRPRLTASAMPSEQGLRLALPETVASGGGAGRSSAPLTNWKPYRLGPEYMAAGVDLHALALQETAGVCGLPGGDGARGGSRRTRAPRSVPAIRGADGVATGPTS